MSLFHDRRKRADRHLEWKVRLFSVAAVAGLCGIYFEEQWMVGVAIVILAAAMALRFLPKDGADASDEGAGSGDLETGPNEGGV